MPIFLFPSDYSWKMLRMISIFFGIYMHVNYFIGICYGMEIATLLPMHGNIQSRLLMPPWKIPAYLTLLRYSLPMADSLKLWYQTLDDVNI